MPIELKMPALSPTMEEGTLARWLVKEGDAVKSGDILAEIETDKATMEFEAVDEGTIAQILVAEGTDGVKVGAPIAILAGDDEDASAAPTESRSGDAVDAQPSEAPTDQTDPPVPESATPHKMETGARDLVHAASQGEALDSADPEVPAGTEMVKTTVREALRDAMAEEMRADDRVFVMGEEVAQYQGAYKVTQGLLDEFGEARVIDTPITEYGFAGIGTGAAMGGTQAHRRVHDLQFRDAGDRPHRSIRRQRPTTCPAGKCAARSCSAGPTAPRRGSARSIRRTTRPGMRASPG